MHVYASMDPRLPLREVPDHARRVERLGFEGLQIPEAVHDGFLTALLALEHTRELRVATSVVLAFPRSPTTVAYAAWDLQSLSGGRFELGLGSQVRGNIEGRFGVPWKPPVSRMREYVQAVRAVWRCWQDGEPLDFRGEHYELRRMQPFFRPDPIERPGIPIHLGAVKERMTELAGEVADGLVTHPTSTAPRYLREVTLPALRRGAERASREGESPLLMACPFIATGPTPEAVRAERGGVREYLAFLYSTPQYWPALEIHGFGDVGRELHEMSRAGRWDGMVERITEPILDAFVPTGTYAEITSVLHEWYADLASGLVFPVPKDPAHDEAAAQTIRALRELPLSPRR